jgi:predicted nucleic acid-binding protein
MTFVVIYDANVLYGNTLRDFLIRIAQSGMVQAKWTNKILDEMLGNLSRNRPELAEAKLDRLRSLINNAVRDCVIEGYEPLIEGLKLPDPGDCHVLAAAIKASAQVYVTHMRGACGLFLLRRWTDEQTGIYAVLIDMANLATVVLASE